MTVGEALAEARHRAGLSVEELSERTKIRGTVIRSIEQDDYEACGGDMYVRGYVRAIAHVVGVDAQPLIREFDFARSGTASERASGSTGRRAKGDPSAAPPETASTWFGLPTAPETQTPPARQPPARQASTFPGNVDATRYDMPTVTANPAATSYDLPRVPEAPAIAEAPAAEFAATEHLTAEFPARMPPAPTPPAAVPPGAAVPPPAATLPPAAVPPGAAETLYDLTAVPGDPFPAASGNFAASEDLMAAGYDLGSAQTPADANAGTQILPAVGRSKAPPPEPTAWSAPGQGGPERVSAVPAGAAPKRRRGLFVVAAVVVVAAVGAVGFSLVSGGGSTAPTAVSTVPDTNAVAAAKASESAVAQAKASESAAAQASASASAKARADAQRVTTLSVASAVAFGPEGPGDGDNPGSAEGAIAAEPSQPWVTQWYATAKFGMLKPGTGLLLDMGSKVTVTAIRLDLSPYKGADLQIRVGNTETLGDLRVAQTANNVGGNLKLTLDHPVAARYLLIWFTQLPPDGSGHYQESISQVAVTGRR